MKFKLTFLGKSVITCCILALVVVMVTFTEGLRKQSPMTNEYVISAQQINKIEHTKDHASEKNDESDILFMQDGSLQTRITIYFEPNLAIIGQQEYARLDSFINDANRVSGHIIQIEGNAATLSNDTNTSLAKELSIERANAVAEYFKYREIAPDKLLVIGNGASNPVGDNGAEEGRTLNRRVDAYLKKVE